MAVTPKKAASSSFLARMSDDDIAEISKFEQQLDDALCETFDGLSMVVELKAPPKAMAEILRRYTASGWDIEWKVVSDADPKIIGSVPGFRLRLTPRWSGTDWAAQVNTLGAADEKTA